MNEKHDKNIAPKSGNPGSDSETVLQGSDRREIEVFKLGKKLLIFDTNAQGTRFPKDIILFDIKKNSLVRHALSSIVNVIEQLQGVDADAIRQEYLRKAKRFNKNKSLIHDCLDDAILIARNASENVSPSAQELHDKKLSTIMWRELRRAEELSLAMARRSPLSAIIKIETEDAKKPAGASDAYSYESDYTIWK